MRKQIEVFKGLMCPVIAAGTGVGGETKTYRSNAPAVKVTEKFDRATSRVAPMPMAKEIAFFVAELSAGKKGFSHTVTYLPWEKGEVMAIVDANWDEDDLPVAESAMPHQAAAPVEPKTDEVEVLS